MLDASTANPLEDELPHGLPIVSQMTGTGSVNNPSAGCKRRNPFSDDEIEGEGTSGGTSGSTSHLGRIRKKHKTTWAAILELTDDINRDELAFQPDEGAAEDETLRSWFPVPPEALSSPFQLENLPLQAKARLVHLLKRENVLYEAGIIKAEAIRGQLVAELQCQIRLAQEEIGHEAASARLLKSKMDANNACLQRLLSSP